MSALRAPTRVLFEDKTAGPDRLVLPRSPWSGRQLAVALGAAGLGLAGIVVGWLGARVGSTFEDQLAWVAVSILCAALGMSAGAGWVLCGTQTLRRHRRDVLQSASTRLHLRDRHGALVAAAGAEIRVSVVNGTRSHRPDCPFVIGKVVSPVAPGSGLRSCEICPS